MHWRPHYFLSPSSRSDRKSTHLQPWLVCPKLALEKDQILAGNLQVKETLETLAGPKLRDWRFSYIDYTLYDILLDDPKEVAAIKRNPLNSTTMWSQEHCITDRMMESSSIVCHTKKHMRHSKKLMTVCVELTNLVQNLEITPKTGLLLAKDDPWCHHLR